MKITQKLVISLVAFALIAAGCGGDDEEAAPDTSAADAAALEQAQADASAAQAEADAAATAADAAAAKAAEAEAALEAAMAEAEGAVDPEVVAELQAQLEAAEAEAAAAKEEAEAAAAAAEEATAQEPVAEEPAAEECTSTVSGDLDECEYGPEFAQEWADLIAAAQSEGELAAVSGPSVADDSPWFAAFADYFGIGVDNFGGATGDVTARVAADRELGDYAFDIANQGGTGTRNFLGNEWIEPALPMMIHPDFFNMEGWRIDFIPWVDSTQEFCLYYTLEAESNIAALWYNTSTVTQEEYDNFNSFRDLLDPRWKGRIVIGDVGGGEAGSDRSTLWAVLGEEWWDTLFRQQEPLIVPYGSAREHADILARGDADFGMFSSGDNALEEAEEQGLPVTFMPKTLAEGAPLELIQRACVMKNAPHPNAAKLFMNWIFTYEGGRVYNESNLRPGRAHLRDDAPQGIRADDIWERRHNRAIPVIDDLNPVLMAALDDSEAWLDTIYEELNIVPGG